MPLFMEQQLQRSNLPSLVSHLPSKKSPSHTEEVPSNMVTSYLSHRSSHSNWITSTRPLKMVHQRQLKVSGKIMNLSKSMQAWTKWDFRTLMIWLRSSLRKKARKRNHIQINDQQWDYPMGPNWKTQTELAAAQVQMIELSKWWVAK